MNLKESFRYQNFLDSIISKATSYLSYSSNVSKTTQEHMRTKSCPEAENETIDTTKDRQITCEVNSLLDFVTHILSLKEDLSSAINTAKTNCGLDIDSAVAINKKKQEVASVFANMGNIKATERTTNGRGYKFNVAGDQVPYTYEIKEVSTIDFDRNKVKAIAKRLRAECDDTSTKLDKIMIDSIVDFSPIYDVNDSFDDVLEQFIAK